jgi:hypothetical protein
MSQRHFQIQYHRAHDNLWCDSNSAPAHDADVDDEAVWKAYVNYLSLAYPDVLYRLISVVVEKKVEIIHV